MDQNNYSVDEEILVQLLRSTVDVLDNMPCDTHTLKQLPGFSMETYEKLKLMNNKFKSSLQEENIDDIETLEPNHTQNGQSAYEINMNVTRNDKIIRVRDNNNDISTNHPPNNDDNNEIQDRDVDNDLADYSVQAVYNNNDIELQNNDISNIETIQGDNKNDPNNSKQEGYIIDLDSDSDTLDYSNDKIQFTNEPDNNDNVEAMDTSDDTRNSPLPTFDDDEDEEWKRLLQKLQLYEDYLNGNETYFISEQANINRPPRLETAEKNTGSITGTVSNTVLCDNIASPSDDLPLTSPTDVYMTDVTEVPDHPNSSQAQSTDVQNNNYVEHVLQQVFKFEKFKEGQEQVIRDVVNDKNNCLIIMPAGSGKSLCYQLPAKMSDGVTIVICQSPFLIYDQLRMLKSVDIKVAHFVIRTEKISETENLWIYTDLESDEPKIKLLYMVPEKLKNIQCNKILMSLHNRKKISRFVIDDAQCISTMFNKRSAYKNLAETLQKYQDVPITVLASSISTGVRADIMKKLNIPDGWKEYRISLDVPNLSYNVVEKTERCFENIAEMISNDYMGQSCIVYCLNVQDINKMASILNTKGITAKIYHDKMDADSRQKVYDEWHSDSHFVICVNSMTGLGEVKAGVGVVVHVGVPNSLEAYCQQAGRAALGGVVRCVLYYSSKEKQLLHMDAFCKNKTKCRRLQLLEYFDDSVKVKCGGTRALCDNCNTT